MLELRTAYSRSFCGSRDEIIFLLKPTFLKNTGNNHTPRWRLAKGGRADMFGA